jgi:hypothetical protein
VAVSGEDYIWLAVLTDEAGNARSDHLEDGLVFGGCGVADGIGDVDGRGPA